MRASLLLVFALAALVAAAEAKKCKGKCVSAGSCEGRKALGDCGDSRVCCVLRKKAAFKKKCRAKRSCKDIDGKCRKKKCRTGETEHKNKAKTTYCKGKKTCICCARDDGHEDQHWGYEGSTGPDFWPDLFPDFCAGTSQSPIDLNDDDDTLVTSTDDWVFSRYDTIPNQMIIKNNGHSAQVEWNKTAIGEVPHVSGGNLGVEFAFAQFHFHWGKSKNKGSEHTINGKIFPAELHLVHFNTKYKTIGDAVSQEDGLAVLGIMLKIAREDNEKLSPIIDGLSTITHSGRKETLATPFALSDLLPDDVTTFYRYSGSLTTPTCNEVVTWTVFEDPITISNNQIEEFRKLLDDAENPIVDNFRPAQPLKGRLLEKIQLE